MVEKKKSKSEIIVDSEKIVAVNKFKEFFKKPSRVLNLLEILIATNFSIYEICDDMNYVNSKNVIIHFLLHLLDSMIGIKIFEKLTTIILRKVLKEFNLKKVDSEDETETCLEKEKENTL